METRISYERLFNLGNYEHEKFIVSKDLTDGNDMGLDLKQLSMFLLDLEEEIAKFRKFYQRRMSLKERLGWRCENQETKDAMLKEIRYLDLVIESFKLEHKPVFRECKCFYCQHPDFDEEDYPD